VSDDDRDSNVDQSFNKSINI